MGFHWLFLSFLVLSWILPVEGSEIGTSGQKGSPKGSAAVLSSSKAPGPFSFPPATPPDSISEISVIQLIHHSRLALGSNRLDEALKWARAAVSKDPAYYESWKQFGRVLMLMGNHDEAQKAFQLAQELKGDDPETSTWVIRSLLAADRLKELAEKLEKASPQIWEGLDGEWVLTLLFRTSELKDRRDAATILKALRRQNLSPGLRSVLNVLDLLAQKKLEEAEKVLMDVGLPNEEEKPFLGLAWFALGRSYQGAHENSKAVTALKKSLEFFPEYIPAWRDLGWALKNSGQKGEAAEVWGSGFKKDPRQIGWLLWIAETRLENKQPQMALNPLNRFLKVRPTNTNAQLLKLTALNLAGQKSELTAYEKEIKKVPGGDQLITLSRALTLQKREDYSKAAGLFEDFYRHHPKDLLVRELLANTYALWAAANPGPTALEPLQKLAALEPKRPGVFRDLGWSLLTHNRFDEAIQAWEKALKDPTVDRKRLIRQVVAGLAEEGQADRARQLFRRWEPGTSFTALGLEVLKANRVIAAREFLQAAWDGGEARPQLGVYLAYAEARSGYCPQVGEHVSPFLERGLASATADDFNYFLPALSICSFERNTLPVLFQIDPLITPESEHGPEVTAILSKAAGEQKDAQNLESAWLLYQKTLTRDPNRTLDWLRAVNTALDQGNSAKAHALLEDLLKRSASEAVKEGIRGWNAESGNDTQTAVVHFKKSLSLDPDQPDLHFLLFRDLVSLKRYQEAQTESEWFRAKVAAGDTTAKGYFADTLSTLGKTQEALDHWQELYLGNPDRPRYGIETARCLFLLGRQDQALKLLDSLLSKTPDPKGFELAAEIWGALGRNDQVLKTTEAGLKIKPTTALWQYQAEAAESLKLTTQALTAAKNWASADLGNVPAHQIWIKALMDLGQIEEARTLLESLLQRNPQFLPSLIHLREIASAKKQSGLAVDYSRETLRQRPWDIHAELQHSISLAEDERFVAAFAGLRPLARKEINKAVPILIYSNVTSFAYPGQNMVSQVTGHLKYLADKGYSFITPADLAASFSKNQPQVMVVLITSDSEALRQIDAFLEKIKGRVVLAGDVLSLQTQVPFQPSPDLLARLRSSGRWVMAWSGPLKNELTTVVNAKGIRGNVLTHKIMTTAGKETAEAMERRLEIVFSEASLAFKNQENTLFLYPRGDYGQTSLDTDSEALTVFQKCLARYFTFAITADPNGYITEAFENRHLMGRNVPPSWDVHQLQNYLTRQNPLVRARLQLGKVLFWQGQHIQAGQWFKKAEEAGADPWEVNYNWGNNAFQYGDVPTALAKLRLAQEIDPDSKRSKDSLERAQWEKKFFINPQGTYWKDSDRRSYLDGGFDLAGHVHDTLQLRLLGQRIRWEREGYGEEKGTRLGLGGKWYFHQDHWLEGRIWNLHVDKNGDRVGGLINLHWSNPLWENHIDLQAAREVIDTVEAIRADIRANRYGLNTYSRLIDSFDLFADLEHTRRTDKNNTTLLNGRLVWRMKEWPFLGLGYRVRFGDSDRKAVEYYAPKKLEQHQVYFNSRGEYELLHYQFSIQAGYAREEDTDWRFVWSTQLHLDLRLTRRLVLYGDYRHQKTPIYEYDEYGLGLLFR
ncbi:MAG: tetratricopeptide repeat protein, partial [Thermodesulfobacteriota bacterium]